MSYTDRRDIVFIVGIPRSGTTWMLSILEEHPDCILLDAERLDIPPTGRGDIPSKESYLFNRQDKVILKKLLALPKKPQYYVEKTPAHILRIGRMRTLVPYCKIILMHRNMYDTIYSIKQGNPLSGTNEKDMDYCLKHYCKYIEAELKSLEGFDIIVRYESLWENPIETTTEVFNRLGLSADNVERIISKTSYGKSLPKKARGLFRKGVIGQGVENLTKQEIILIDKRALATFQQVEDKLSSNKGVI